MLKALLRKQFRELGSSLFVDRRSGTTRSKAGIVGFSILYVFIFVCLFIVFFGVSFGLLTSLLPAGLDGLYFTLMGLLSIFFGTFGSAFNTYAGLYNAKDNELLLAMPIPPSKILFARLTGVVFLSFAYSASVWLPATLCYLIFGSPSGLSVVFSLVLTLVNTLFVSVFCCALGFLVALIAGKLKKKSFLTVIISLAFIGTYYFVYFKASELVEEILLYSDKVGDVMRKWFYPFYILGEAATGKVVPMMIFVLLTLVLAAICFYILKSSFIRIVTTNRGSAKNVCKETKTKRSGVATALRRRELRRFLSSSTYMLNCGLGLILLPIVAVVMLVKGDALREVLSTAAGSLPLLSGLGGVLVFAAVGTVCAMNVITAPSVSLEGSTLWIVRSLPVSTEAVLRAKVELHVFANFPVAAVCTVLMGIAAGVDIPTVIALILAAFVTNCFVAVFGLMMNLKKPLLSWTNEAVPIRQSTSVLIAIFAGWGAVLASSGIFFALSLFLPTFLACLFALIPETVGTLLFMKWLRGSGCAHFEEL